MNKTDSNRKQSITRRNLMRAGVGGIAVLLAGCMSSDDPAANDDSSSRATYRSFASYVPTDTQFNPHNPTNKIVQGTLIHWVPLMQYHVGTDQWIPMIASDWRMEGKSVEIEISDEFSWHNGDAVTADDVGTRLKLMYHMNSPLANYLSDPPVVGDGAVELSLATEVQEDIFWPQLTANDEYHMVETPASIYGEYVERFEDASSDSEREQVQSDLLKFSPQEPGKEVLGNGPFEFIEATEKKLVFERYDKYPVEYVQKQVAETIDYDFSDWPDEITVERFEFQNVGDLWSAYRSGTLDGGANDAPAEVYNEFPDSYNQVGVPRDEMWGLTFQYDDDIYGRRNVRKAFAHLIERSEKLANQMFPLGKAVDYESGMTTSMTEEWISSEVVNGFTDYMGRNYDEAAALLEEEGFSQDGDEWYLPNGDRFQMELRLPSYDDIIAGMQVVEARIAEFGIQTEFNAMELATFTGDVEPNGDFTVIASSLGNQPHPLQAYQFNWLDQQAQTNYDLTVTVPEIGDAGGEPTMEVDLKEILIELTETGSANRAQEIIDVLAWVHNQDVPYVACAEKAHQYCVSYADWEMPETAHEGVGGHDPLAMTHTPWHFPIHCGAIRPK